MEMIRQLNDTELDDVNGGEGNLANAAIRATIQWLQDHTYQPDQYNYDCPRLR